MSTRTSYAHGTPCWVDVASPDVDAAKAFYQGLFGWGATDEFDDDGTRIYTNFDRDGQVVCGLGGQQPGMEGMPAIWMSYVAVDDAEAMSAKVEAAGGTVIMPAMQIMDAGKMAVFSDPSGAAICVWEAGNHFGAAVVNEPNTYSWNELNSRDLATVKPFYASVFGWEYEEIDMGPPTGIYHVVAGGEEGGLAGMMDMPAEVPAEVPDHWLVYFIVEDADAMCASATALGGTMAMPPFDTPVGRIGVIQDPHMGAFAVMQVPAS